MAENNQNDIAFALTPAAAYRGLLDYSTTEGRKLYYYACSKLSEEPFDCKTETLYAFLESVHKRATDNAWNDEMAEDDSAILLVPEDLENPDDSEHMYLIQQYGEIPIERLREYASGFVFEQGRGSQNDYHLYSCLWQSLTEEAKSKVLIHKAEFTLTSEDEVKREIGVLLLKVIIRESHLSSHVTASQIRIRLSSLDTYIVSINSDITKFNQYVHLMLAGLKAQGESSDDLLVNLFKGYLNASDKQFVKYITWRQERYEDGEELTYTTLMNAANEKYKTLKDKKLWNAPTPEQKEILALKATIEKHQKNWNKHAAKNGQGGTKDKGKGDTKSTKPKALSKTPGPNDPTEVMWGKKKWYWCAPNTGGKCNHWRTHKPADCKTKSDSKPSDSASNEDSKKKRKKDFSGNRGRKIVKALEQVIDSDSEGDVYDE